MTDTTDKPTLQDIADKDAPLQDAPAGDAWVGDAPQRAADSESDSARESVAASTDSASAKGGGFVWLLLIVIIAGGSVAAGWPYIGPYVSPYVGPRVEQTIADLRATMGLEPRPTQARLPSEPIHEAAPETAPQTPPGGGAMFDQMANAHTEPDAAAQPGTMPTTLAPSELAPSELVAEPAAEPVVEAPVAPAGDNAAALQARLDALDRQVAALGAMIGADGQAALAATRDLASAMTSLQTQFAVLSQRLQTLEDSKRADPTVPAQAMVLGVTQLRARLTGDQPFTEELNALEHIAAADAVVMTAVQNLRPYAETGVASKAALTARFGAVAKAIIAARTTAQAEGWLGAIKDRLAGLVVVRRTDPTQITDEVERAVALSEAALDQGALAEAVSALNALQGAPGDAAAAWLSDAVARVNADAVSEALYGHALAALSAAGGA